MGYTEHQPPDLDLPVRVPPAMRCSSIIHAFRNCVSMKSLLIPAFLCSTACSAGNITLPPSWQRSLVPPNSIETPLQCLSPDQLPQRGWNRGTERNQAILVHGNTCIVSSPMTKPTCKCLVIILTVPRSKWDPLQGPRAGFSWGQTYWLGSRYSSD